MFLLVFERSWLKHIKTHKTSKVPPVTPSILLSRIITLSHISAHFMGKKCRSDLFSAGTPMRGWIDVTVWTISFLLAASIPMIDSAFLSLGIPYLLDSFWLNNSRFSLVKSQLSPSLKPEKHPIGATANKDYDIAIKSLCLLFSHPNIQYLLMNWFKSCSITFKPTQVPRTS